MYEVEIKDLNKLENKIKSLISISAKINITVDNKKDYRFVIKTADKFLDKERGAIIRIIKNKGPIYSTICVGETSEVNIQYNR